MRRLVPIAFLAALACGDDGATGPTPAQRFAGTLSLEAVVGSPLPVTIFTPSDTLERRATTLEIGADGYLPRALFTDSLVEIDAAGTAVANASIRDTLIGFVAGDTVRFTDPGGTLFFRFTLVDGEAPVRLQPDGSPIDEVWSRR